MTPPKATCDWDWSRRLGGLAGYRATELTSSQCGRDGLRSHVDPVLKRCDERGPRHSWRELWCWPDAARLAAAANFRTAMACRRHADGQRRIYLPRAPRCACASSLPTRATAEGAGIGCPCSSTADKGGHMLRQRGRVRQERICGTHPSGTDPRVYHNLLFEVGLAAARRQSRGEEKAVKRC